MVEMPSFFLVLSQISHVLGCGSTHVTGTRFSVNIHANLDVFVMVSCVRKHEENMIT